MQHTLSVVCIAQAHHTLVHDWCNFSLATVRNPEWLIHSVFCVIDFYQQANFIDLRILYVKENFHQIIDVGIPRVGSTQVCFGRNVPREFESGSIYIYHFFKKK